MRKIWPWSRFDAYLRNIDLQSEVIRIHKAELAEQDAAILELKTRLNEARRRTIPFRGGAYELNILPEFISRLDMDPNTKVFHGINGESFAVGGQVKITVECSGEIVSYTNLPAERAK